MPFVSGLERMAKEDGLKQGQEIGREIGRREQLLRSLERILKFKFGPAGQGILDELRSLTDVAKLDEVEGAALAAETADDLRKVYRESTN